MTITLSKLRKFLFEKLHYSNWRKLSNEEIKFEYKVEYSKLRPWSGDVFPTEKDFINAVKNGKIMIITKTIDNNMSYRSHTQSIEELKKLVSHYQYPRDVDKIVNGYKNGDKIPYPIVIRKKNTDNMRIMAGNTRLDVAFILGFIPQAIVIDI